MSKTKIASTRSSARLQGKPADAISLADLPSTLHTSNSKHAPASPMPSLPTEGDIESPPLASPDLSRMSSRTTAGLVSDRRSESALPPVDGGRQALMFLASATLFEAVLLGYLFSFSIFQDWLTTAVFPGASPVTISIIGTLSIAFLYGLGFVLMPIYGTYPEFALPTTYVAFAIAVIALLSSSWATSVTQLIVLQGVIYGLSVAVIYPPIVLFTFQWWHARRNLAWSVICAGGAIGGFAVPLVLGRLLRAWGYANTIRAWATFLAITGSLALLGIKPREPYPSKTARRPPLIPRDVRWLLSPLFLIIMLAVMVQALGYFTISIYISPFTSSLGYEPFYSQLALALFNVAGAGGQIGTGFFSDRRPYGIVMLITSMSSALLAFLLFGFAGSLAPIFVFVILFGAVSNGFSCAFPAASQDIAGDNPQTSTLAFAFLSLAKGLSGVLGPTISGSLVQTSTEKSLYGQYGYRNLTIFVGVTMASASLLSSLAHLLHRKYGYKAGAGSE